MARKKTSRTTHIRESSEIAGLELNPASQSVRSQLAKRKLMRASVYVIAFALVPLSAFSAIAFLTNQSSSSVSAAITSESVNDSDGKAAAIIAVNQWLGATPAPLPNGFLVSWDGFELVKAPPADPDSPSSKEITYVEERHFFTLSNGITTFDSQVLVLSDGDRGVKTVSTPSLMPRPAESSSDWYGESPWFGYSTVTPSDEVVTEIEGWAEDLVSGSPRRLKSRVNDPSSSRAYVPLDGVSKVVDVAIVSAGTLTPPANDENPPVPTDMLVRVQLTVIWQGQSAPAAGEQLTPITYDLLLTGVDTSAPKIVSWGGAGSGTDLSPYSVGLEGVKLQEPQTSTLTDDEHEPDKEAATTTPATTKTTEPVSATGGH